MKLSFSSSFLAVVFAATATVVASNFDGHLCEINGHYEFFPIGYTAPCDSPHNITITNDPDDVDPKDDEVDRDGGMGGAIDFGDIGTDGMEIGEGGGGSDGMEIGEDYAVIPPETDAPTPATPLPDFRADEPCEAAGGGRTRMADIMGFGGSGAGRPKGCGGRKLVETVPQTQQQQFLRKRRSGVRGA